MLDSYKDFYGNYRLQICGKIINMQSENPKKDLCLDNDYLRSEAEEFFEWCRFNLSHLADLLDQQDKELFKADKLPLSLITAVKATWLEKLKSSLNWKEHYEVIRKALPDKLDFEAYMKAPYGRKGSVSKKIRAAVAKEHILKQKKNHAFFLATSGRKRIGTYLRIWQSQSQAFGKLMIKAEGIQEKTKGGARIGGIEVDVERMLLSKVEATGSAMKVRGLLRFIRSLWEEKKTILIKANSPEIQSTAIDLWGLSCERRVVPNPAKSEKRLNRFLIKLGRALAATGKRREIPDWEHMDQTVTLIVQGWCQGIIVDNRQWPMLCLLSTPALAKFLSLCVPPLWKEHQDPRTLERKIRRLGLLRIPAGRIKHVKRTADGILMS